MLDSFTKPQRTYCSPENGSTVFMKAERSLKLITVNHCPKIAHRIGVAGWFLQALFNSVVLSEE